MGRLALRLPLLDVYPGEEHLRLFNGDFLIERSPVPRRSLYLVWIAIQAQLLPHAQGRAGHEGSNQQSTEAQNLPKGAEHRVQTLDIALFAQLPRLRLVDIFITGGDERPEDFQRFIKSKSVHRALHSRDGLQRELLHPLLRFRADRVHRNNAPPVFIDHLERAV